ncbi:MAG: helicase-related protein [Maricaulaceae bacterium]
MTGEPFEARVTAALGPTNTGKTHLAVERMLGRGSGVMGFPLRLLAREIYDRVCKAKGPSAVALLTGEEKIAPPEARYFICTVEAMPQNKETAFVGVDEIQLAADPERGHVFTDRLLHARGSEETMLLGAETMRPLVRALVPEAWQDRRERLSTLTHIGPVKLTKLPRRTAVVAFSAEEVYAIAELMRRHRGGAAVVMGGLSPRTRNAQVELYQSGEVDFIVATDAIGMGLNLDVDHVAFASLSKFDGMRRRPLTAAELAQIAGRAGRFRADGTFGATGDCAPIDPETVERIENHRFEPVRAIQWRNADLDFSSVDALQTSLAAPSPAPALRRARQAADEAALAALADDPDLGPQLGNAAAVRRAWSACQLPDFRRATVDQHVRLVARIARSLLGPEGRLPEAWIKAETEKLDNTSGEVDALAARLAHIRTWTYAANREDWLADAAEWRERARAIEERLSDALHERLTQRFVDRRSSAIMRGLRANADLVATVSERGDVEVEGHFVGELKGLSFAPDKRGDRLDARALSNAALSAVRPEITRRLGAIAQASDDAFSLGDDLKITWDAAPIARLAPGSHALSPRIELLGGDLASGPAAERAVKRLETWLDRQIDLQLGPLNAVRRAPREGAVAGLARGLCHELAAGLGVVDRRAHDELVADLSAAERRSVRALGVRIGEFSVYLPALIKPAPARLLALLHAAAQPKGGARPFLPQPGRTSLPASGRRSQTAYAAAGYRRCGPLAVRLDMLERLADALRDARRAAKHQPFAVAPEMLALLGCSHEDFAGVLRALGYRSKRSKPTEAGAEAETPAPTLWTPPRPPKRSVRPKPAADASPFAALAELSPGGKAPASRRPRSKRRRARPAAPKSEE